uniref:NADH-ubiquinone oxidoreductase chain 1 n=1 Tax=Strigops habroptila TaxID=2489341 RepID=A0A672U230_STRHB
MNTETQCFPVDVTEISLHSAFPLNTLNQNLLAYIIPILIAVAFLTLVERKILTYIQARMGPNIVGPFGLLQPAADGTELFIKEPIRPSTSSPLLFITTPIIAFLLAQPYQVKIYLY